MQGREEEEKKEEEEEEEEEGCELEGVLWCRLKLRCESAAGEEEEVDR